MAVAPSVTALTFGALDDEWLRAISPPTAPPSTPQIRAISDATIQETPVIGCRGVGGTGAGAGCHCGAAAYEGGSGAGGGGQLGWSVIHTLSASPSAIVTLTSVTPERSDR
jgi:hypothetical protein